MPELSKAYLPEAAPWLELCTQLTRLSTASLSEGPSEVHVSVGGWLKGRGQLVERAVKLGCIKSTDAVNLINVKNKCGSKVNVSEPDGCSDVVTVEYDGGLKVTGRVLGDKPILSHVTSEAVGLITLSGCVIVAKGTTLAQVVQEVQGISEVYSCTLSLSLSLSLSPVRGCVLQ